MIARAAFCLLMALASSAQQAGKPAAAPAGAFQISGTLVDSTNDQPLAHARVAIAPVTDRTAMTTIVTADDGRFVFPGLAAGKYTLTAQRRGYLTQSFNQHDQFSSSIAVGEGNESSDLVFRLSPEAVISGAVTDEQGEAVAEAQVLLFKVGGNGDTGAHIASRNVTNDEGAYRFGHLLPGKYLVAVSARPWYAQSALARATGRIFTRVNNNTLATTFPGDAPRELTDESSPLDVAYAITFYPGAVDPAAAEQVSLSRGDKAVADVSLQPVPALHFRVTVDTAAQQATPSLQTRIFDTAISLPIESHGIDRGKVILSGVAPGHYSLKWIDYSSGQQRTLSEHEVDVSGNGDVPASQIQSRVPVTASVQIEPGVAQQGQIAVSLSDKRSGESFAERLNAKGEAEFGGGVPPGNYEISVRGAPGVFLKSVASAEAKPVGRMLTVKGPGPVRIALVLAAGQARISGVALKGDKPFAGAMVLLVPADPAHNQVLFRRDQSDTDGTFTLADVVPGKYTLLALENGWDLEWTRPSVLKPFLPQGEAVVVQPNGKLEMKLKVQ
jgi:hypothetical protein